MYNRMTNPFLSQYGRPLIFVPGPFPHDLEKDVENKTDQENVTQDDKATADTENKPSGSSGEYLSPFDIPLLASYQNYMNSLQMGLSFGTPSNKTFGRGFEGRQRKTKRENMKNVSRAEDVPEYKGQMSVDDLVNFINSGTSPKDSAEVKLLKKNSKKERKRNVVGRNKSMPCKLETADTNTETDKHLEEQCEKEEDRKELLTNDILDDAIRGSSQIASDTEIGHCDSPVANAKLEDFKLVSHKKKRRSLVKAENFLNESKIAANAYRMSPELDFMTKPMITDGRSASVYKTFSTVLKPSSNFPARSMNVASVGCSVVTPLVISGPTSANICKVTRSTNNPCNKTCSWNSQCLDREENVRVHSMDKSSSGTESSFVHSSHRDLIKSNEKVLKPKELYPPVMFTGTNGSGLVDSGLSFGFDSSEVDSGFESASDIGVFLTDPLINKTSSCSLESMTEKQHETNVKSLFNKERSAAKKDSETGKNRNLQGTSQAENIVSSAENVLELKKSTNSVINCKSTQQQTSSSSKFDSMGGVAREKNLATVIKSDKSFARKNLQGTSKAEHTATKSVVTLSVKQSTNASANGATTGMSTSNFSSSVSLSNMGRPVSIVAPNQPLKGVSCSVQSSCSSSGRSSCSSVVSSLCSGPVQSASARAPVLKVAPMLVEKLSSVEMEIKVYDTCVVQEPKELHLERKLTDNMILENLIREPEFSKPGSSLDKRQTKEDSYFSGQQSTSTNQEHCSLSQDLIIAKQELCSREQTLIQKEKHCSCKHHLVTANSEPHHYVNGQELCSNQQVPVLSCPERCQGGVYSSAMNGFDLLCAQIFLYKTFTDSLSEMHYTPEAVESETHPTST